MAKKSISPKGGPKKTKTPKSKKSSRSPVITVMGHIDHGKTTLLDALRKTTVQAQESGGITQHIGAYQVEHQGRKLTFIDTPGHAAFASMRSRGAQVTDLVVLVVDAIESVKPQTKECIDHIKSAKAPFLVAINKMDLPNATPAIVKKDLADAGVSVEGYGGDIVAVEVSAKTGKNLDQLLEMLLLLADMQELKGDPKTSLEAVVIESSLDQKKGPLATVIVKNGTLKIGDDIQTSQAFGKVKALFNDKNQPVKSVLSGEPAQVLGFKKVPAVGAIVANKTGQSTVTPTTQPKPSATPESEDKQTLKIILKADVAGTLEAITQNLSDEVTLIASSVGDVNESDILLAQSTNAKIIGFRIKVTSVAKKMADTEGILVKTYSLIHELLDDLQQQVLKMLEPTIDEEITGEAKITVEFTVKGSHIAGCQINSGKFVVGDMVHLVRKKQQVGDSKVKAIHQGKDSIDKAKKGDECGLSFTTELDFKPKDILQAFKKIA
ncbi:translation initiation factor IF-2 [Patescibacteria group bacterium]